MATEISSAPDAGATARPDWPLRTSAALLLCLVTTVGCDQGSSESTSSRDAAVIENAVAEAQATTGQMETGVRPTGSGNGAAPQAQSH